MTRLKEMRKNRGLSQLQLADFVHESPSTVAMWETGTKQPHLVQTIRLCRVLECCPCDLFENDALNEKTQYLPLFDLADGNAPQMIQLPDSPLSRHCHFAVILPYQLSHRVQAGDMCYFELTTKAKNGDIVLTLDGGIRYTLCICNGDTANIAAVCRMMSIKM